MTAPLGWVVLTNDVKQGDPKWEPDWDGEVHTERELADRELADCRAGGHQCILGTVVPCDDQDAGISFTRGQVEAWAGRELSDDELARLEEAVPNSTFPETVALIVDSFAARCTSCGGLLTASTRESGKCRACIVEVDL